MEEGFFFRRISFVGALFHGDLPPRSIDVDELARVEQNVAEIGQGGGHWVLGWLRSNDRRLFLQKLQAEFCLLGACFARIRQSIGLREQLRRCKFGGRSLKPFGESS